MEELKRQAVAKLDHELGLEAAIKSAEEFKYLLDTAPAGTLRHLPFAANLDVRETRTYENAMRLLLIAQSILKGLAGGVHP